MAVFCACFIGEHPMIPTKQGLQPAHVCKKPLSARKWRRDFNNILKKCRLNDCRHNHQHADNERVEIKKKKLLWWDRVHFDSGKFFVLFLPLPPFHKIFFNIDSGLFFLPFNLVDGWSQEKTFIMNYSLDTLICRVRALTFFHSRMRRGAFGSLARALFSQDRPVQCIPKLEPHWLPHQKLPGFCMLQYLLNALAAALCLLQICNRRSQQTIGPQTDYCLTAWHCCRKSCADAAVKNCFQRISAHGLSLLKHPAARWKPTA